MIDDPRAIGAGDSTVSVASTVGGFAATYGILSIDDELIVYTAKTATQFTGRQREAVGTVAASHLTSVPVKANMVAGFITAVQSAVVALETELGTAAARNCVQKNGAVTITGVKTFQDGAAFGAGNIAGTGLVRLPNLGAVKWRKADNSGGPGDGVERRQPRGDGRCDRLRGGSDVRRALLSRCHDDPQSCLVQVDPVRIKRTPGPGQHPSGAGALRGPDHHRSPLPAQG